jgi:pimeloyl-ACP methyl ester carboxylesterase
MEATQRPATLEAVNGETGDRPLWREVPSWFVIAEEDRNIPAALQRFMAERADARGTIELSGASHTCGVSRPDETADMIREAAAVGVAA